MRSNFLLLLLAFITVFAVSCGSSNDEKWVSYTSANGGFVVNMPSGFKETEKQEKTAFGTQLVHTVSWKPATMSFVRFKLFQVSYTNCSVSPTDSIGMSAALDSSIHLRIHDFTDNPVEIDQIEFAGHPGRAFILDIGKENTITVCKECIANGKKYELTAIALKSFSNEPQINAFFDSFRIQ